MDDEQHAEIIARLDAMTGTINEVKVLAKKTNGRVTDLEGWRADHQLQADVRERLLEDHRKAIEMVQERFTEVALACQTTPANLQHAVAKVLDQRQTTEDAAKYRALVKRFGDEPEEGLSSWNGLQAGVRAVGGKVAVAVATILVLALLAAVFSIWAVSLRGGA